MSLKLVGTIVILLILGIFAFVFSNIGSPNTDRTALTELGLANDSEVDPSAASTIGRKCVFSEQRGDRISRSDTYYGEVQLQIEGESRTFMVQLDEEWRNGVMALDPILSFTEIENGDGSQEGRLLSASVIWEVDPDTLAVGTKLMIATASLGGKSIDSRPAQQTYRSLDLASGDPRSPDCSPWSIDRDMLLPPRNLAVDTTMAERRGNYSDWFANWYQGGAVSTD